MRRQKCAPAIVPLQLTVSHMTVACCRFGVDYSSSCSIDLVSLLSQLDYTSNGPRFYDPYIMQVRGCEVAMQLSADSVSIPCDALQQHMRMHTCIVGI